MPGLASAMNPKAIHRGTPAPGFNAAAPFASGGNPAADAQVAWNQKFGPFTSTQVGQQRDAGQPVGQAAAPAVAGDLALADGTQPGGPGMAGGAGANVEASFPGFFKGTPEPGIPKEESGASDVTSQIGHVGGAPGPAGKGRLVGALGSPAGGPSGVMGSPSGTPLGQTPPQVPGGTDPGAAAVQAQAQTAPTPGSFASPDVMPTLAASGASTANAPRQPMASAGAQPQATVTGGPAKAAETGAAGTVTRGYQGVNYTLNKPLPPGWAGLTPQAREAWLKKNATPTSPLQASAVAAVGDYFDPRTNKFPTEDPNGPGTVVLTPSILANRDATMQALGGDTTLYRLAEAARNYYEQYGDTRQADDTGGMNQAEKEAFIKAWKLKEAALAGLAPYGIFFPSNAPATPPAGGGDGTGGGTGGTGGTGNGDGTTGGTGGDTGTGGNTGAADGGGSGSTPIQDFPSGDTVGAPVSDYGPNFNISSPEHGFIWYQNQFIRQGMSPEQAAVNAEAAVAADMSQSEFNNRQSDVNISAGALNEFKGSDLYKGSQKSALDMLNEGDPTDWEGIKNRRASDAAHDVQSTRDTLSTSGARRGLSPGAIAGIGTRAASESRMGLSRALGELDVEQAQSKRNFQTQALQNALATMGGTSGVALSGAYNVGSKIAGNSTDYQNPYAGAAAGLVNVEALQAQKDAAEQAGKLTVEDALGMITTIGAGLLGGPAGAAIFGGSALAGGKK